MRGWKIGLVAILLAWSADASAATYYVDQTAGNDSNNGTSPSTPWKNSPGMAAYTGSGTLNPGDTVMFDRGDTWVVTGTQGLYLVGGVTYIGDSWGTGTRAAIKAGADLAAGVIRFRDHPTSETVFRGFEVNANGTITTGIDINHAFFSGPQTGATKRVQNCDVHHIFSRLVNGQYKYGIIMSDFGGANGEVANVEILNNVVHDTSRDAICLYPGDVSADCRIRNITVRGNEAYNTGQDPDYCCGAGVLVKGNVQDSTVENNWVHDVKGASVFINSNETNHFGFGPTNIHIRNNILKNSTANGAIRIYDGPNGGDPKDIKVYGNIVYNSTVNGGLLIGSDLKSTLKLLVYNNTFFNAPVIINSNSATVNPFEFRNNVVYYTGGVPLTDASGQITAHSNNMFFRGSGTLVSSRGSSFSASNLASYESTGSSADPLFKNSSSLPTGFTGTFGSNQTPNTDGLSLLPGSWGIDHGFALTSLYTGSINTVPRPAGAAWDVGAYESGGTATPPSPPKNLRISRNEDGRREIRIDPHSPSSPSVMTG